MKKACVAMPVYNESLYIERSLSSLIAQDEDDVFYFISDNCSTDDSWDIIKDITGGDERFKCVRQKENIGACKNIEFCLQSTQSEYFMWLGAHDYISENYIKSAIDKLDHDFNYSMAIGTPYSFKENEKPDILTKAIYEFSPKKLGRYLQSVRQLSNCTIFNSLFRRSCLHGFKFSPTISFDHVLISRLLWYGNVAYMEGEKYFRRYFDARNQSQMERLSGGDQHLSRYDFIRYYLDDFSLLYSGDIRMKSYLEKEIIDALQKRFGIQSIMPNDEI